MVEILNLTSLFNPFSPSYFSITLTKKIVFLQWRSSKKVIVHMKQGYLEMNHNYAEAHIIMHTQDLKVIEIFVQTSTSTGPVI